MVKGNDSEDTLDISLFMSVFGWVGGCVHRFTAQDKFFFLYYTKLATLTLLTPKPFVSDKENIITRKKLPSAVRFDLGISCLRYHPKCWSF